MHLLYVLKHMHSWSNLLILLLCVLLCSWTSDGQYFAIGMQNGSVSIRNKVRLHNLPNATPVDCKPIPLWPTHSASASLWTTHAHLVHGLLLDMHAFLIYTVYFLRRIFLQKYTLQTFCFIILPYAFILRTKLRYGARKRKHYPKSNQILRLLNANKQQTVKRSLLVRGS